MGRVSTKARHLAGLLAIRARFPAARSHLTIRHSWLFPCRYAGEGRVAQRNFKNPRWVEGELLVFNAKGSPLTGGAELGFVWAVPGEKRFLILLNKVDLRECEL